MKLKLLFLVLLFSTICQAQVDLRNDDRQDLYKEKKLTKFKNTETIFVLPENVSTEKCEALLNEYWTATPFKLVTYEDFNMFDYLQKDHSFVQLELLKIYRNNQLMTFINYMHFFVVENSTKLLSKLENTKPKKRNKKLKNWIHNYVVDYTKVDLYLKNEFNSLIYTSTDEELIYKFYTENVFHNLNEGFFKNYIQQLNESFSDNIDLGLHSGEYSGRLKDLASQKLYIPAYVAIKLNKFTRTADENVDYFTKVFDEYTFDTEIMTAEDISQKIINNDDFYYLRLVRTDHLHFDIVHSISGDIIYSYTAGLIRGNLTPKDINSLNKKIKKAVKKYNK